MVMSKTEAGRKGLEAGSRDAGRKSEGSKKSATATRGHENLSKAGAKGGSHSQSSGRTSQRDK
jgi:hypothetical protein